MFGIGMPELIVILVVALIVFGPKKLPELAKALGRGLSEFKRAGEEIKESLNVNEDLQEVKKEVDASIHGLAGPTDLGIPEGGEGGARTYQDFDEVLDSYQRVKDEEGLKQKRVEETDGAEKKEHGPQ